MSKTKKSKNQLERENMTMINKLLVKERNHYMGMFRIFRSALYIENPDNIVFDPKGALLSEKEIKDCLEFGKGEDYKKIMAEVKKNIVKAEKEESKEKGKAGFLKKFLPFKK